MKMGIQYTKGRIEYGCKLIRDMDSGRYKRVKLLRKFRVCPSCGATRMVLALMDGNIYQAFRFNPYLLVTLAIPLIYLIDKNIKYIKKKS